MLYSTCVKYANTKGITALTGLSNSAVVDEVIAVRGLQTPKGSSQGQVFESTRCTLGNHGFICIVFLWLQALPTHH